MIAAQHVLGLEVAVDHTLAVRRCQPARRLRERVADRLARSRCREPGPRVRAGDALHHHEQLVAGKPNLVDRQYVFSGAFELIHLAAPS
jgi:hypothetical protein